MIEDRALRILIVVGLVLFDAVLAIALISWIVMGFGMTGDMMGDSSAAMGMMVGTSVLAFVILVAIIAALIWALREPSHRQPSH